MSPFYKKKRRVPHGPSKNEAKGIRQREAERQAQAAGLLRQRFPSVQRLSIQLEFVTPQQHLLDQQTRAFGPSDLCDFSVPCVGRCGGEGSFNLEEKIKQVISARQTVSESRGVCQQPLFGGSSEACGSRLQCKIEADYAPEGDSAGV